MDLTGVYDAHIASADLHSTAATSGSVRSAHGLILLASLVVSENEDARSMGVLRSLDRFVVPGKNGAKDAARVIGALRSLAPALPTGLWKVMKQVLWAVMLSCTLAGRASGATEMAVTIDDLPTHGALPKGTQRTAIAEQGEAYFAPAFEAVGRHRKRRCV